MMRTKKSPRFLIEEDDSQECEDQMNQAQRDHDPKSSSHDPSGQLLWLHVTCYERSCIVPLMGKAFLKLFGQIGRMFWTSFPRAKKTWTNIKARSHIAPESSEKEPFR